MTSIKYISLIILFILLSFTKGWTAIFLIALILPLVLIWLLVLSFMGRNNYSIRDKYLLRGGVSAIAIAFFALGTGDTKEMTAFTAITLSGESDDTLSVVLSLVSGGLSLASIFAFLIFFLFFVIDMIKDAKRKNLNS